MKPGGKFNHLGAIGKSLREAWTDLGQAGVVAAYQRTGILDEKVAFHASAIEESFIKEPFQRLAEGMVGFFEKVAEKTDRLMRRSSRRNMLANNPLSRLSVFAGYAAKDAVVGTGEDLGTGYAMAYTARTSDQLVEGLSLLYAGTAGVASMIAGGVAGKSLNLTIASETTVGGIGVQGLAVGAVGYNFPVFGSAAGATAGGGLVCAAVGGAGGRDPQEGKGRTTDDSNSVVVDKPEPEMGIRLSTGEQELVDMFADSFKKSLSRPTSRAVVDVSSKFRKRHI